MFEMRERKREKFTQVPGLPHVAGSAVCFLAQAAISDSGTPVLSAVDRWDCCGVQLFCALWRMIYGSRAFSFG